MATRFAVASGNWSNTAIWDNGALPVAGDFVYANGNTVTIDQNVNVGFISNGASGVYVPDISTPAMTGSNTPSGVASASSETSSSFSAWLAFDQNPAATSGWQGSVANAGWLRYDFPSSKIIRRYAVRGTGNANTNPRIWTFEGSNDGTTWTVLHTVSLGSAIAVNTWYDSGLYGNTTAYTKYRINITAVGLAGTTPGITELCMTESTSTSTGVTPNGTFTMPTAYNITCTHTNGIIFQGAAITAPVLTISATTGSVTLNSTITGGGIASARTIDITGNGHDITVNGNVIGSTANATAQAIYRNASGTLSVNGLVSGGFSNGSSYGINNTALGTGTINIVGSLAPLSSAYYGVCLYNLASVNINITGDITSTRTANSTITFYNAGLSTVNIIGNVTGCSGFSSVFAISNVSNATFNITGTISGGNGTTNHAINSTNGAFTIIGNIIGGSTTTSQGINVSGGTVTVNGTVTGGSNGYGIFSTGTSVTVTGDVFAAASFPALASTAVTTLFLVNGSIYNNGYTQAIWVARLGITPNTTMVYRLATNTGAAYNFYPVGSTALGTPATTDVRNGVTYASGALTGTLVVPLASAVTDGVIFDNGTIGTAQNTAASFLAELAVSTDPLAERLRNVSTVQTTGAQIAAYNV